MKDFLKQQPDGYTDSIRRGMKAMRLYSGRFSRGTGRREENIRRLKTELEAADAILIGAGAGLSTSAGLTYSGERFQYWFGDFAGKFGIRDMYSGGFQVMQLPPEELWAYWSRHIYVNRYIDAPVPVYPMLLDLVKGKEYFVLTTNVDHQFQRAGFDKARLFYTQGDYGLWQSVNPGIQKTYDNARAVLAMMEAQGFEKDADGVFHKPEHGTVQTRIPTELIPKCPDDGSDLTMNLRSDDSFVEDEGWHNASARYAEFLQRHGTGHVLYLELGVGGNTPVIIKYPFWAMTGENPAAVYACLNYGEAVCPQALERQSICIDGDIGEVFTQMKQL